MIWIDASSLFWTLLTWMVLQVPMPLLQLLLKHLDWCSFFLVYQLPICSCLKQFLGQWRQLESWVHLLLAPEGMTSRGTLARNGQGSEEDGHRYWCNLSACTYHFYYSVELVKVPFGPKVCSSDHSFHIVFAFLYRHKISHHKRYTAT